MSGPASLRLALAGACVAAVLLAGCGGGGSTTVINRTVTDTTPSTDTTTTEPATTTSKAPTAILHLTAFQSPSGNIGCMIVGGTARCDIVKRDWSPPPHPARCPSEVDFGQGLEVGRTGTGRFVCAGDTTMDPSAPRLAYGTASRVGGFLCVSRSDGITCSNGTDASGFFISIQGYRVF